MLFYAVRLLAILALYRYKLYIVYIRLNIYVRTDRYLLLLQALVYTPPSSSPLPPAPLWHSLIS